MVIYITGASGYLGNAFVEYFVEQGHKVVALSRKNVFDHPGIQFFHYSLGKKLDTVRPKPDVCIHCAYDLKATKWKEIYNVNVLGSEALFEQLSKLGCKTIVHISSLSAFDGCRSKYGRAKLLIEEIAGKYKGISIRPGLIHGGNNSGLIGKLKKIAQYPVIPMIGNGNYPQFLTDIDRLCQLIHEIVMAKYVVSSNVITLSSLKSVTLREIVRKINSRAIIIPLYWKIPYLLLNFMEALNIDLPLKADSISGLVFSNETPDFRFIHENKIVFE